MHYNSPLVSVAMATHNGVNNIYEQLSSIISQTYPKLEIIITDENSTDGTLVILENFKNKYGHIKLLTNPVKRGISACIEHSIKHCRGEYIALSDQDDIWEPNKIEALVDAMKYEDLIYSDSEMVDQNGQSLNRLTSSKANLKSFRSGAPFLTGNYLRGNTMLIQGDFARYILPIPTVLKYDRWISFCAAANNGIKYLDIPLVKYRQPEMNHFVIGKTKAQKYHAGLLELKACETAPIKDTETKKLVHKMIVLFTRNFSVARCWFFFKNRNKLLVIKEKTQVKKILFSLKMLFKANY